MADTNGCPTLADKIKAAALAAGVQDPKGAKVILENGETIVVFSADNPALTRTDPVAKVEFLSQAKAGRN